VRAVVQRVSHARVTVQDAEILRMADGLLAFIGVGRGDEAAAARELARRIVQLRIFEDARGRMNRSLLETGGTLGVVSQFTLFGDARQGRRPSFGGAAPAEQAAPLVEAVAEAARALGVPVVCGRFGAHMAVELVNAGPVTVLLDSERRF
jgi:D-tyrosyl-tRNA(Tyr) deacylase